MSAIKTVGLIGGFILGTAGIHAGATALLRKGLGSTLSYTSAMIAGGVASTAYIALAVAWSVFDNSIKNRLDRNEAEKLRLLHSGCAALSGGIVAKLLSRDVTKTQACALSVFSFVTSSLELAVIGWAVRAEWREETI